MVSENIYTLFIISQMVSENIYTLFLISQMVSENIYILRKDLNRTNEGRNNFHAKFYIFQTLLQMYYIYFNNKHIL
jgi:hypothetical protein